MASTLHEVVPATSADTLHQLISHSKPQIGVFVCVFDLRGCILCVRRNYGRRNWTTPGGMLEDGEMPWEAARREAFEETGFVIEVTRFIGTYVTRPKNSPVMSYSGHLVASRRWRANSEIAERRFFPLCSLPETMSSQARLRIADATILQPMVFRLCDDDR